MSDRPLPFRRSIAIVVGIDAYDHGIPRLETAVNDARRLSAILRDEHSYEVTLLLNEEASLERLTRLLTRELPAMVEPEDRVLWYFAGHGVALPGDTGPDGYLLPADAQRSDEATFLRMPLVHDALLALTCRHLLVILDSCFSGAFRWSGTRDIVRAAKVVHREKFDRYVRDAAWQVITSASQDQKALDQLTSGALGTREGVDGHSPFALALFDALAGKGDLVPDGKGDGLLLATELFLYIDDALRSAALAAGHSQAPQLWPLRKHGRGEFLFFIPGRELSLPPAPALTSAANPWRGLASYESADARLFFGREAETARLVAHTLAHPLSVVLGGSGSGKSSLVKAGLAPILAEQGWHMFPVVRPGSAPLTAITSALGASHPTGESWAAALQAACERHPERRFLLIIDQFEELISLGCSHTERDACLRGLADLCRQFPERLRVVVTLRTDFEPNVDRSAVGPLWNAGRFLVAPMTRENLRAVIEHPAQLQVVYFEPASLVERLLDEVTATPGALPLLSFALSEMYLAYLKRQSDDRSITQADYEALGGVAGALRARAESEYDALDAAHRATLQRLMLRLVVADGGTVARRRVTDDELEFEDRAEQVRVSAILTRLIDARLLVRGKDPEGVSFIEPAHDALVRGWGRLLQWIREEGDAWFPLAQRQRLTRAAAEWERGDRAQRFGLLWSDPARSAQLAGLIRSASVTLNRQELDFARKSVQRRRWVRRLTVGAVVALAVAGVVATITGLTARSRAEQVRIGALVQTAGTLAQEDPLTARLLLASLNEEDLTRAEPATRLGFLGTAAALMTRPTVYRTWGEPGSDRFYMQLGADGASVVPDAASDEADDGQWAPPVARAEVTAEGNVAIVEPGGLRQRQLALGMKVRTAAVSPDSRSVAFVNSNGRLFVGPARAGSRRIELRGHTDSIMVMAWSPNGRRLATWSYEGIRVWDPATGQNLAHLQRTGEVPAGITFHKDVDLLVARSMFGYEAVVWRWFEQPGVLSNGHATILSGHADRLTRAHFTPDGLGVFTASMDGTARLWSLEGWTRVVDPAEVGPAARSDEEANISAVAFAPNSRTLAFGTGGGTIGIVHMHPDSAPRLIAQDQATPRMLTFDSSGTRLTALSVDGELKQWRTDTLGQGTVLVKGGRAVHWVQLTPDGHVLTRGDDFEASDPGIENSSSHVAFRLDGRSPAVPIPGEGPVVTTRAANVLERFGSCLPPSARVSKVTLETDTLSVAVLGTFTSSAAFEPRSRTLAVGMPDGALSLHVGGCSSPRTPEGQHTKSVEFMEFSPQGRQLLTVSLDGTVKLWAIPQGRLAVTLRPRGMGVDVAHFTPDGRRVLTLPGADSVAYLWNADGTGAPAAFSGFGALISSATLSPDGRWLANASRNGILLLWPLDETELLRQLRRTEACLSTNDRVRYLGETLADAAEAVAACIKAREHQAGAPQPTPAGR